jgi:hypothetical protein
MEMARWADALRSGAPSRRPPVLEGEADEGIGVVDASLRSRTARAARAALRRMEPVVVLAPRWGALPAFLEELALDLALGEPAIGCRSVDLRPLAGRPTVEAWQYLLQFVGMLGHRGWAPPTPVMVADRRGFRWAVEQVLQQAHDEAPHPVALLAHGAEALSVELLEDLTAGWDAYRQRHPEHRRCALLLGAADSAAWLRVGDAPRLHLADFGLTEAAAAIVAAAGPLPVRELERCCRELGGVPGVVEVVGREARRAGRLPAEGAELWEALGPLQAELRGAVDIVAAHDGLAGRLQALCGGRPLPPVDALDRPLMLAGLARAVRVGGVVQTSLRAPIFAGLLG